MGGRTAVGSALVVWLALLCGVPGHGRCLVAMTLALGSASLAWRAPPRVGTVLALVALGFAGAARGGAARLAWDSVRLGMPADGAFVRLRGVLTEPARRESGEPLARLRVLAATPAVPRDACVRLRLPAGSALIPGECADLLARLDRPGLPRNPGGFSPLAAARATGIVATGRAYVAHAVPRGALAEATAGFDPRRVAAHARAAIEEACARRLSPPAREWLAPLLIGDRTGLTPESEAHLRGAGLVHLLALSGLHVVWFAGVVRGVAALLGAGILARSALGLAAALGYLAIAGPFPSLLRAVTGECWTALAVGSGRALDPLQSLGLSALVLLLAAPAWAYDLGFQLSCVATLGLVTLASAWQARLPIRGLARAPLSAMTLTAAAQLVTMPLLLARFHALPWAGLVANLAAVPLAELLLTGGVLLVLAESLAPGSGQLWASACEWLAAALARVAAWGAAMPGSQLAVGHEGGVAVLLGLGAGGLVLATLAPRAVAARARAVSHARAWAALLGAACVATGLLAALTARPLGPPVGHWWLVAIDVGQGDALALATPGGWWLVDAGPRQPRADAGETAVLPFLRWAGVRGLRGLLLTHDDGDHVGGAAAVRRGVRVHRTWVPGPRPGVAGPGWRFPDAGWLARGDTLPLGGVPARLLWPPRPGDRDAAVAERGDNATSLVLEVGSGAGRALLTGDADSLVEGRLMLLPGLAVLKAGHHGSPSSSGVRFLERVRPRWVLLSVGRRNPYGHPAPAVLDRLARTGARAARTDRFGAVWFEFGDDGVRRLDWRRRVPEAGIPAMQPARAPER